MLLHARAARPWPGARQQVSGPNIFGLKASYFLYPNNYSVHVTARPQSVVLLKATHSLDYSSRYHQGMLDFRRLADAQRVPLLLALLTDARHWQAAGARHFAKLAAIRLAWSLGFEWPVLTDLDMRVPHPLRQSLHHLIHSLPARAHLILQHEEIICSCLMIVRRTQWSDDLLRRWWSLAVRSRCCDKHSFDQLALWGVLAGVDAPRQFEWPRYVRRIMTQPQAHVYLTTVPLHHAPCWSRTIGPSALFHHHGHAFWNTDYTAYGEAHCPNGSRSFPARSRPGNIVTVPTAAQARGGG